jgi:septum formation protein
MSVHMILASGSQIRATLLHNAGVSFEVIKPRIDEESIKAALRVEAASPRDIADCLAETKARKVSDKRPGEMVLGCDQVLDLAGTLLSKPTSPDMASAQLSELQNTRHHLLSAAVLYQDGKPLWRHVGKVVLHMRPLSEAFIGAYVARNWDSIRHAVGAYKLEEEGVRLFTRIEGDYFNVLGLPLLELLNYLTLRGDLES